jgi:hypothetical protein
MYEVVDEFGGIGIVSVESTSRASPSRSQRSRGSVAKSVVLDGDTGHSAFVPDSLPIGDMAKFLTDSRGQLFLAKNLYRYNFVEVLDNDTGGVVNN